MTPPADDQGVLPDLDPVIHAQARLRVMVALSTLAQDDELAFPRLRDLLGMTAGNLSTHLRKLEDAGYVRITKTHQLRTPVTYVGLTRRGRLAFETYTQALQTLLNANGQQAT
jgi:DNA-binding MarR family transcriptional regulator